MIETDAMNLAAVRASSARFDGFLWSGFIRGGGRSSVTRMAGGTIDVVGAALIWETS